MTRPPLAAVMRDLCDAASPQTVLDVISRHQAAVPVVWDLAAAHATALDGALVRTFERRNPDLLAQVARNPAVPPAVRIWVAQRAIATYPQVHAAWARSAFEALLAPGLLPREGAIWQAVATLAGTNPVAALAVAQVPDLPLETWTLLWQRWPLNPVVGWVLALHAVAPAPHARHTAAAMLRRWVPFNATQAADLAALTTACACAPVVWDHPVLLEVVALALAAHHPAAPKLTVAIEDLLLRWQATARFLPLWRLLAAHDLTVAARVLRRAPSVRAQMRPEDLLPLLTSDDAEIRLAAVASAGEAVGATPLLSGPRSRHAASISGR